MGTVSVFNVKDFGAVGNGSTDDVLAIQAAVNAAAAGGGTVYFPVPGQYLIGKTIAISSKYPVVLLSEMVTGGGKPAAGLHSYVRPSLGGDFVKGMFHYFSPGPSREDGGGGAVIGLALFDTGNRAVSLHSGLNLEDFNSSYVKDCYFHYLLGSAIVGDFMVQSVIDSCQIRYCGNNGASALRLGVTSSGGYVVQSTSVVNCRLEVNYLAPYIQLFAGANQTDNKILGCGFEADTTNVPASSQVYVSMAGDRDFIGDCHFARNDATSVLMTGNGGVLHHCNFYSTPLDVPILELAGPGIFNRVDSCRFFSDAPVGAVTAVHTAGSALFTGCEFVSTGSLVASGPRVQVIGCVFRDSRSTYPYQVDLQGESLALGCLLVGNTGSGGIRLSGTAPATIACLVDNSSVPALPAIRVETPNAMVAANRGYGNAGPDLNYNAVAYESSKVELNEFLSTTQSFIKRGGEFLLGRILGANFNTTTDQGVSFGSDNVVLTAILVTNASVSLTTAAGGIYTGTGKSGTVVVAAGQHYTTLTSATRTLLLTLAAPNDRLPLNTLYLSLATPQGAAATANVYFFGYALDDL